MPVKLVSTVAEADSGKPHHQLINRLKYTDAREMLAEYRASNAMIGRKVCPVCDHLESHIDADVIVLERAIYTHPDWGPSVLMETLINAPKFNDPATEKGRFICAAVQHVAALELVAHPWERARPYIEAVFHHDDTVFVSLEAMDVLLDAVLRQHPNPGRFVSRQDVRVKLPAERDFSNWPSPDFRPDP